MLSAGSYFRAFHAQRLEKERYGRGLHAINRPKTWGWVAKCCIIQVTDASTSGSHLPVGSLVTGQTSAGIICAGCTELLKTAAKMADCPGVFTSVWALMPVLDKLGGKNSSQCSVGIAFKSRQGVYTCLVPWVYSYCVGCYRAAWMTGSKTSFP